MKKFLALLLVVALGLSMVNFAVAEAAPETVTVMFHGNNVTDDTAVLEKLNEYLGEKIGVNVDVIWGTWGDFEDKAITAITGGDTSIDMYFTCSWSANEYNTFAKKGYWLKLDDLIAEYAPELVKMLPEPLMKGATIEGSDGKGVYAINGYKDYATQNCWDVNVNLLEELGYTFDDVKGGIDYYAMGDMLAKAKEVKGENFYPLLIEPMVLERMVTDTIIVTGDSGSANLLSYYLDPTDVSKPGAAHGNVILNKFATEEYKKFAEKTREYYLAGYINPALAIAETANDTRASKQLTGEYLFGTQSYALGYEYQVSAERGIRVEFVPTTSPYVDTTASQGALIAISSASEHPVASIKFLNLLNTDPYVMTMLNYGLEGVHYNLKDGMVEFTDKRADYTPWRNGMGNITMLPAQVAEGADYWDTFKAYYNEAKGIPMLGFIFDTTNVEVEMTALSNVAAQYALALDAGAVDPATELPKFLEALEAAGIQKYLDEANAQFTAFLGK